MGARKAIIIGAGIGGLSAAHALRRSGWCVTVYEQAPVIAPVGAGVGIAPNAVKALDHLGLGAALRERGRRQIGLEIRLEGGARVAHIPAEGIERRYGAPFYALHRAELHSLLMAGLDPGTLRTGHRAEGVAGTAVSLRTADGTVSDTADLIVAADGVNSPLRAALLPGYPGPAYAGYTVWRGIVPPEHTDRLGLPAVLSETWGAAPASARPPSTSTGSTGSPPRASRSTPPPSATSTRSPPASKAGTIRSPRSSPPPRPTRCCGTTCTTCVPNCPGSSTAGWCCSGTPRTP